MIDPSNIDDRFALPIILFVWALCILVLSSGYWKPHVDNFFANRRHKRRQRVRAQKEREAAMQYLEQADGREIARLYHENNPRKTVVR